MRWANRLAILPARTAGPRERLEGAMQTYEVLEEYIDESVDYSEVRG